MCKYFAFLGFPSWAQTRKWEQTRDGRALGYPGSHPGDSREGEDKRPRRVNKTQVIKAL